MDRLRRLQSQVRTTSEEFVANRKAMESLVDELRGRLAAVRAGGSERSRQRHLARGKMLPRDRVEGLLDPGSPFLELSPLAAYDVYDNDSPSAGVITGVGRIRGHLAMVIANDATVKGGTLYPISVKKNLRAQTIAYENRLPRGRTQLIAFEVAAELTTAVQSLALPRGTSHLRDHLTNPQFGTDRACGLGVVPREHDGFEAHGLQCLDG